MLKINLYDNLSFPMRKNEIPNADEPPVGYFEASENEVQKMIDGKVNTITGHFIYNHGDKPRIGEHLINIFAKNDLKK